MFDVETHPDADGGGRTVPDDIHLCLTLYGQFSACLSDGTAVVTKGAKTKAILALLATSPDGQRSRNWLQTMLWSRAGRDHGRASLRQAISSLRQSLGTHFDRIFDVDRDRIGLRPRAYVLNGHSDEGAFLEDLELTEDAFVTWKRAHQVGDHARRGPSTLATTSLLPSILVTLPVVHGVSDQGAGLGDEIAHRMTRSLSRSQVFFVISHLSSRMIDPSRIDMGRIVAEFQAAYVVTGRIHAGTDMCLFEMDLVESFSGRVLWTGSFEVAPSRFADQVSALIETATTQIARSILSHSVAVSGATDLPQTESHALMVSALVLMNKMSRTHFTKARQLLEELVRRTPRQAEIEAWLAQWYLLSVSQGWSLDHEKDRQLALDWANRALDINPLNPVAQVIHANILNVLFSEFDAALVGFQDALEADPNLSFGWLVKSMLDAFTDNGAAAVQGAALANRLSPLDPRHDFYQSLTATAYLADEDYTTALDYAERSLARNRFHLSTQRVRIIALDRMGRGAEAARAVTGLLKLDPHFTVDRYLRRHPAAEFRTGQDWAAALRSAGVPQT